VGDRLLVRSEGNAEHDELVSGRGLGVGKAVHAAPGSGGEHAFDGLLGAALLARADRHLDAGGGEPHGQREAK